MLRLNDNIMKVKKQSALTLIEVLLVVSLLLLVLIAAFRSFRGDINRSRDAQRKSDLRDIKLAFEDYHSDHGGYPPEEFLADCGGDSLQPYLREVPCDPETGLPYLYFAFGANNSSGYRVLSILDDLSDPVIQTLGCQNGCGVPAEAEVGNSYQYVYGIAEGVPLLLEQVSFPTETPTPSSPPTPIPTMTDDYCYTNRCYCCGNSSLVSQQSCNVWAVGNNCDMGPYRTVSDCTVSTPCE